jgi:hypothetical protein
MRSRYQKLIFFAAVTALVLQIVQVSYVFAIPTAEAMMGSGSVKNKLQSAGALAFGPNNVLFVGDSKAGMVHAFELSDSDIDSQVGVSMGNGATFEGTDLVSDIGVKAASLLGAKVDEVRINDMVVHKPSKQVFLSVHRGHGPDTVPAILKVNKGQLEILSLKDVKHSSASVGPVPVNEKLEFGQPQNMLAITDIDYWEGEIFVSGVSNEEFASKLRRMAYPFDSKVSTTSIEIWHAVHAQFETRAPIITKEIRKIDGTPTLIAVYACTPLVRIPLDKLKDGEKVRGEMIGELGFGNTPIDIISYKNAMDGKDYVLVTNTNRSAKQVSLADIGSVKAMPVNVKNNFGPGGVAQYPIPLSGARHLDLLDAQWAVVIRTNHENPGRIDLHTLPLPFFFDRSDHVVEMNWPGSPDPFGYKKKS